MLILAAWDAIERPRDPPLSAFCSNGMGYFLVSGTAGVCFSLTYKHWILQLTAGTHICHAQDTMLSAHH